MPARKPVQSPQPRQARPLAQQPAQKNPLTRDIMQRVNKAQMERQISKKEAAAEIGVSYALFRGWQSTGGAPIGDNLVYIQRWLHRHDKTFFADIIDSKRIRLLGDRNARKPGADE